MDPDDGLLDDAEQAYEQIDEKALLIEQCALLASIDAKLDRIAGDVPDPGAESSRHKCSACGSVVDAAERRQHLEQSHGAPAGVPLNRFFDAE